MGKHVDGGGIDSSQHSCLQPLTPGRVAALLGEMTCAGVTSTGAGERLVNLCGAKIEVGGTGGAMEGRRRYGLVHVGKHRCSSLGAAVVRGVTAGEHGYAFRTVTASAMG